MACRVIFKPGTESVDQVFATNGRPSILFKSLTDASQGDKNSAYNAYIKTQTQSFKNWFGASKVVDENGEPLVVYHGSPTASNIQSFDSNYEKNTAHKDRGFYFTTSKNVAKGFIGDYDRLERHIDNLMDIATEYTEDTELDKEIRENIAQQKEIDNPKNVIPVFLNLTDPIIKDFKRSLKPKEGYSVNKKDNGAIFKNVGDSMGYIEEGIIISDVYVAFKPNQIKHAVDNAGEFNQNLDNMYAQRTSTPKYEEVVENKELKEKLDSFLESLGIRVEAVNSISDRDGNILDVNAAVDMVTKTVKVIEGHSDITTLPEEASHFFVQLLKQNKSPLYNSMRNLITKYKIYDQVAEEYNDLYEGNVDKIADEAIGKLISRHLIQNESNSPDVVLEEDLAQMARATRWWDRVLNYLGKLFKVSNDPYKSAAYRMLNQEVQGNKDTEFDNPDAMYQASTAVPKDNSPQAKLISSFMQTHNSLRKEMLPIEDIPGLSMRIVEEGETEKESYVYTNPETGVETNLGRVTNITAANFAKKHSKETRDKMNSNPRNKHLAEGGTRLHGVAQNLMEFYGSRSKVITVEPTHSYGIPTSLEKAFLIDGVPTQMPKELKDKFISGIRKIITQLETTQKEINIKEGTPDGKMVLLTELQIADPNPLDGGAALAGTMDVVPVFSNGKIGIVDFKFISPKGFGLKGFGKNRKLNVDPLQVRIESFNTQIGAYKNILINTYDVPAEDFVFTRIAPIHIQYKLGKGKKAKTLTNEIEVLEMGADQNDFMSQLSVAGELTNYPGLNKFLRKLYRQRDKYKRELQGAVGTTRINVQDRIKQLDKTIQGVTVQRNIAVILSDAQSSLKLIKERLQISDPNHADYLTFEELRNILQDFGNYTALNDETSEYIAELAKIDPEAAAKIRIGVGSAANYIETNHATIQNVMFDRLISQGAKMGLDTTEAGKEMNFAELELSPMSTSKNPIMRQAYKMIFDSFNKTKEETDAIRATIMSKDNKLSAKYGSQKFAVMSKFLINPKTGDLIAKLDTQLYDTLKEKQKEGDIEWLKDNMQIKADWPKKVGEWRRNKVRNMKALYPDDIQDGKIVKSNAPLRDKILEEFDATYDLTKDSAWKNPRWQSMLEFKPSTIESNLTEEYKTLSLPENKELKEYYEMYWQVNQKLNEITPEYLKGNFVAWTRDDMMQSVINNGFSMSSFQDRMSRTFTTRHSEEMESNGRVNPDGSLISSIPLPGIMALRNSKGDIDVNLKSKDLSKSLYGLSMSVYNFKHMGEIESVVLALGDQLASSDITKTDAFGNIIKEDGVNKTETMKENKSRFTALKTFQSQVDFYLYGHSTQSKDKIIAGVSMNRFVKASMNVFSAKKVGLAILPAVAAKLMGSINIGIQSIDGVSYNREGLANANKMFVGNNKQYSFFATVFDASQTPQSWAKARNMSAKKAAKYLEFGNIYEGFRWADEATDRKMTVAMGFKHGLDPEGNIRRLEQLPAGSKNLHELTIKNKDGTFMIQGMTQGAYDDMKSRIKNEGAKIKGQMDDTDILSAKLSLMGAALGQFKWWMPGLLAERIKGTRFNPVGKYMEEGRYGGLFVHYIQDAKTGNGFTNTLVGALKSGANAAMELSMLKRYKGDPAKRKEMMDQNKWTESMEAEYNEKKSMLDLELRNFKNNSTDPNIKNISLEEFMKMRTRSVKRTLSEIRSILGMYLMFAALGAVGEDDDKYMQQHYLTRQIMKVLGRTRRELGFVLDPREFTNMLQGGIPVIGLFNDAIKVVTNGSQELYDVAAGKRTMLEAMGIGRTGRDKTPLGYELFQFAPGFEKLRMVLEPYSQDKVNQFK